MWSRQYVSEWSLPVEKTSEALRAVRDMIDQQGLSVHMPVEVRFVKGDDLYMSPAYGRDSVFINNIS